MSDDKEREHCLSLANRCRRAFDTSTYPDGIAFTARVIAEERTAVRAEARREALEALRELMDAYIDVRDGYRPLRDRDDRFDAAWKRARSLTTPGEGDGR